MRNDKRFVRVFKEGSEMSYGGIHIILVDRLTGVNYLYVGSGYGGGLTPLLGADGRPIVTPLDQF